MTLDAPTSAAPGSTITLTANINSRSGVPTGQVTFLDGNHSLGISSLNGTGVATLRINTLAGGSHTLTASYDGDEKFGSSTSPVVTIDISNPDFSIGAAPPSASVIAGQSTQFMLTVTPAGGFANNVTLSCSPVSGITCAFSPATVTPANGPVSTRLTVTTSGSVSRYGEMLTFDTIGPWALLFALGLCSLAMWSSGKRDGSGAAIGLGAASISAAAGDSHTHPDRSQTSAIAVDRHDGCVRKCSRLGGDRASQSPCSNMEATALIESFVYATWICGQAVYWLCLKHRSETLGEECWRVCLRRV